MQRMNDDVRGFRALTDDELTVVAGGDGEAGGEGEEIVITAHRMTSDEAARYDADREFAAFLFDSGVGLGIGVGSLFGVGGSIVGGVGGYELSTAREDAIRSMADDFYQNPIDMTRVSSALAAGLSGPGMMAPVNP